MKLTRRNFLKLCGAGGVLLGMGSRFTPIPPVRVASAVPLDPKKLNGFLIDTTKCIGCKACQVACKKKNNLPLDDPKALAATSFCFVDLHNISSDMSKPVIKPVKRQCMHCNNPSCVSACTVGAITKLPNGPVVYDTNKCIGCRYCMYACPFGVPTFEWDQTLSLMKKCPGCSDLVSQGQPPACVKACPTGTLQYGNRQELLTIAHQRFNDPKTNYVKHVYGETELGGTSAMYLSAVPFESLGFPELGNETAVDASQEIMHSTPWVAGLVATTLTAFYFITRNRASPDNLKPEHVRSEQGGER